MRIVRAAKGVPAKAARPEAKVLECDVHRSTAAEWKWCDTYLRKQKHLATQFKKGQRRRDALRPFCGRPVISAVLEIEHSIFHVFVDPKAMACIRWEVRTWAPDGRETFRSKTLMRGKRR